MSAGDSSPYPSWLRLCAYGAFAAVIPSALWRVLMIIGLLPGTAELREFELAGDPALRYAYVVGLSVMQLATGYLAVGLVRPWGTTLFGRQVPPILPLVLGTAGGVAVTWIFNISMVAAIAQGSRPDAGLVSGWPLVIMVWCYLPILLWGPLVVASSWGHWHHRRTAPIA
ncbi:hypothetical protein EII34_06140 [Arachnia propionica]|uniref:Uncharacterized protein n=1 Tax=Arachnia propionica TaxID=1750 RepID=A0A3P1T9D1_9ACTN|nr:hypothetical protein [Arachnia propionica]RRD05785.1 hypothetical protein EII34_06140 [Arachnia propionica]